MNLKPHQIIRLDFSRAKREAAVNDLVAAVVEWKDLEWCRSEYGNLSRKQERRLDGSPERIEALKKKVLEAP